MDFELKTLNRARLCTEKCDALVVLVPQVMASGNDALSSLIAAATRAGDFEAKPGNLLQAYRPEGLAATRLLLVGVGDGTPRHVRSAVLAAMAALKSGKALRLVLCLSLLKDSESPAIHAALLSCGDAAYQYSATKSKAPTRHFQRAMVAVRASAAPPTTRSLLRGRRAPRPWSVTAAPSGTST